MSRRSLGRIQGIGSGLIPRNLNAQALVALRGLSDTPADDIVALLRSEQPIDAKIRHRLADAIEGKLRGVRIRVTNPKEVTFVKKLMREFARVRQGRLVRRQIQESQLEPVQVQGKNRESALKELAEAMGKEFKTAESCLTLADRLDGLIVDVRCRGYYPELTDTELTVAFLSARIDKLPPESGIDDALPALVNVVLQFQKMENEALGPQEWFLT